MNKKLTLEDITKLESAKLFTDAGYELTELPCDSGQILSFRYELKLENIITPIIQFNFLSELVYVVSVEFPIYGKLGIDTPPVIEPILKLLEELQIDSDIYLENILMDNISNKIIFRDRRKFNLGELIKNE